MKTEKIHSVILKFRFTFNDGSTMESQSVGASNTSIEVAKMNAWLNMAYDEFERNLILKTTKIELI